MIVKAQNPAPIGPDGFLPEQAKDNSQFAAYATPYTGNDKTGAVHVTYAAQKTCPSSCPWYGQGCYAEQGHVQMQHTQQINNVVARQHLSADDVSMQEAASIKQLAKMIRKGNVRDNVKDGKIIRMRPLRIHIVGDCLSDKAAKAVSSAAAPFPEKWAYTHSWDKVNRSSWGGVSVLASCETPRQVQEAHAKGYASAIVVEDYLTEGGKAYPYIGLDGKDTGFRVIPCPAVAVDKASNGKSITCGENSSKRTACKLCFKDKWLHSTKSVIAFSAHGIGAAKIIPELRRLLEKDRQLIQISTGSGNIAAAAQSAIKGKRKLIQIETVGATAAKKNPEGEVDLRALMTKTLPVSRMPKDAVCKVGNPGEHTGHDAEIYQQGFRSGVTAREHGLVPSDVTNIHDFGYRKAQHKVGWGRWERIAFADGFKAGYSSSKRNRNPGNPHEGVSMRELDRLELMVAKAGADEDFASFDDWLKWHPLEWERLAPEQVMVLRRVFNEAVWAGSGSKRNPNTRGRRASNPEPAAADLYRSFHGSEPTQILEYEDKVHEHEYLTGLGDLIEIKFESVTGYKVEENKFGQYVDEAEDVVEQDLSAAGEGDDPEDVLSSAADAVVNQLSDVVRLCSNEDGTQLFFVGGDQNLDDVLKKIEMTGKSWEKEAMVLGVLYEVTYRTRKKFHKFKLTDYYHGLGEETGVEPVLIYDFRNKRMSVAGGQYLVKPEGIVN